MRKFINFLTKKKLENFRKKISITKTARRKRPPTSHDNLLTTEKISRKNVLKFPFPVPKYTPHL